jgi:hypothetical protein
MLAIPLETDRRMANVREELRAVIEPARGEVTRIQLALPTGEAAFRDYLETRDPAFLVPYRADASRCRSTSAASTWRSGRTTRTSGAAGAVAAPLGPCDLTARRADAPRHLVGSR